MPLFVPSRKAPRRALEPKQGPAPEQTLAPEPVVEPAPIAVPKTSQQPLLIKPEVPPAPAPKPNTKPSIETRQGQILNNFNGYNSIKPPKKTPEETGEQLRLRVQSLPTNDKAKTIDGFTAKQKMLLHEATRAEARRAPDAPNPANERLRDRSGLLKEEAIEKGKAVGRAYAGWTAQVINAPADAVKRSAETLNALSDNILSAKDLPKSGQIRVQRQIASLFRDINSGAHLGSTIEGYKKYLKSGDVVDFPPDLIKLSAALNARSAGFEESEITQIVRDVEEKLKAKKESVLNDFIEGAAGFGRKFVVKFLAKQNRILAKTAQNKIASGKALSLNERIALRAEEAIGTGKKSAEAIGVVKKVGKKAKSALTSPIDGATKEVTKQASKALTKGVSRLTPEALKSHLSTDTRKRIAQAFQDKTDQELQKLAKQFVTQFQNKESKSSKSTELANKQFEDFVNATLDSQGRGIGIR